MTKEFLHNFIGKHKLAVLSTVTQDHLPQSAVVGFIVTPDLKLFFDTHSDSRKYKNLSLNPKISFVIGWDLQTVQYEGTARKPTETELEKLLTEYFKAFPDGIDRNKNEKNIAYFCVEPNWIRYSDFSDNQEAKIEELKM
jgi:general stress protein 26